jgi:hypothetical protein
MGARTFKAALLGMVLVASAAHADELPVGLQVQLLSKLSTYVAEFGAGSAEVKILVVHPSAKDPSRGAQALSAALSQAGKLGKHAIQAKLVPAADARSFQTVLTAEKPQVVYLAPELDEKATREIIDAVTGTKVLTLSGVEAHVRQGVVLGFSMVEARPRVLINLKQAQKQNIVFLSGLVSHSLVVDR